MSFLKILVADDEPLIRNFIRETLQRKNFEVILAENGEKAIEFLTKEDFDIVFSDMKMPKKTGMEVLEKAKNLSSPPVVILMTAFGSIENAVEAMQKGAFTYLIKPFSVESIETIIEKVVDHLRLKKENAYLRKANMPPSLISTSPAMQKVLKEIEKVAPTQASVFISGESGTGKEVVAKALHNLSLRKENPFIRINCAAIPENLLESELFGYEKGAFTGANERKEGKFEVGDTGTILLDEITEIPLSLQPKLLRAIQEQEFERVGGTKPIKVNLRFLATTNRNIEEAIAKKIFREDLFFRLNVVPIHLPPLRERKEDIIPLANFFLKKFSLENHKPSKTLSSSAEEKLMLYPWPGNVRELANIMERIVVLENDEVLLASHIPLDDFGKKQAKENFFQAGVSLKEMEKQLIIKTLMFHKNNRTQTAATLGISIRTLTNKLRLYRDSENFLNNYSQ